MERWLDSYIAKYKTERPDIFEEVKKEEKPQSSEEIKIKTAST